MLEPLFELLLKLSTMTDVENTSANETQEEVGENLTSLASSCLLSLVIAWGVTPRILQALDALITVSRPLAAQIIVVSNIFPSLLLFDYERTFFFQLPNIMLTLQKGVRSTVIGTSHVPDWFTQGIQQKTLVTSFSVNLGNCSLINLHTIMTDYFYC
jgi:hypothetical protein